MRPVGAREPEFWRSPAIPTDPELIYDALHLGRHKCASTYLQRSGLASHPEVDLVWRDHKAIFYEFWEYEFGSDVEEFLERLRSTPLANPKPTARVRVFSNEGFCGDMFTGRNARLIADLTVRAFGAINYFLIVREPYSYVYSVWNQYVQEGGVLSVRDFLLSPTSPTWSRTKNESLLWQSARSMDLIRYWTALVGSDRFFVFLLEDMVRDPEEFWGRLYGSLGVATGFRPSRDPSRGRYPHSLAVLKLQVNRLLRTAHNPAGLLPTMLHTRLRRACNRIAAGMPPGSRPDLARLASPKVRETFIKDNVELSDLLGRDLSAVGFRLG